MNGFIDFNAVIKYAEVFNIASKKLFIEIIYKVDEVIKKEQEDESFTKSCN